MNKNPGLAAALSLVPGLGHFYLGLRRKALALGLMSVALAAAVAAASDFFRVVLCGVYLVTAVPAAAECYRFACTGGACGIDSRRYVVLMLLTNGFSALPLLWQSPLFSHRAKIAWTAVVPVLAALFFSALVIMAVKK